MTKETNPSDFYSYFCLMKINWLKNYNRFILLIWTALWLNFLFQYSLHATFAEALAGSVSIILTSYPLTTWLSTTGLKRAMKKQKMLPFVGQFFGISLAISVVMILLYKLFRYLEHIGIFPPSELLADTGTPLYDYLNSLLVALFTNFGFCGLRFFEENLKLQNELTETRMEILRTQINPHFMFNVLNHIHILMRKNTELASSLLLRYADILRYQLYCGKEEYITLAQETNFLKDYIEVEKLRWKNQLHVDATWEIENENGKIPPLLFIPFIENAFKHVSRSPSEKGYIAILMKQQARTLRLTVENSRLCPPSSENKNSGLGLTNIRKRLDILYPGKHRLEINETHSCYCASLFIIL